MPYVKNKTDTDFKLVWNGMVYILKANDIEFLPDDIVKAYFPQKIEDFYPAGAIVSEQDIIALTNIFLSRWGNQLAKLGVNLENFYEFIQENFDIHTEQITEKKEEEKRGRKKIISE